MFALSHIETNVSTYHLSQDAVEAVPQRKDGVVLSTGKKLRPWKIRWLAALKYPSLTF